MGENDKVVTPTSCGEEDLSKRGGENCLPVSWRLNLGELC